MFNMIIAHKCLKLIPLFLNRIVWNEFNPLTPHKTAQTLWETFFELNAPYTELISSFTIKYQFEIKGFIMEKGKLTHNLV